MALVLVTGNYTPIAEIIAAFVFSGSMAFGILWMINDIQKMMKKRKEVKN